MRTQWGCAIAASRWSASPGRCGGPGWAVRAENSETCECGLRLTLPRSNGDRAGSGVTLAIPYGATELCPMRALRLWQDAAGITDGAVFRRIWRPPTSRKPSESPLPSPVVAARQSMPHCRPYHSGLRRRRPPHGAASRYPRGHAGRTIGHPVTFCIADDLLRGGLPFRLAFSASGAYRSRRNPNPAVAGSDRAARKARGMPAGLVPSPVL